VTGWATAWDPERAPARTHDRAPVTELEAARVSYRRGGRQILDDVSLGAYSGEALAITGPSGSGKSSLLALLAGLEVPDDGMVLVDGEPLAGQPPGLGLVLQGYGLVSILTAAENVEVVLQSGPLEPAEIRQRSAEMLEAVGLEGVEDHLVEQLSGGQQQRVAIARALIVEPDVLLVDEVTAELDSRSTDRVLRLLFDVADRGGILVMATHDPAVADECHQVARLVDGRLAD
jgi:putative ABC transport system ATP-binding protein